MLKKTSMLLFSNRMKDVVTSLLVNINDAPIYYHMSSRFLGVEIGNRLKFSIHINHIAAKLSKTAGILYSIRQNVPRDILISLYCSLVYPYLCYGVLLLGDAADVLLNPLILVQKIIIRIISNAEFLAHTLPLSFQNWNTAN